MGDLVITVEAGAVRVGGTVDLSNATELAAAAEAVRRAGRPVEIDLRDLEFIDSIGLRELIRMERNGGVTLLNPPERVMQLLHLTGTNDLFAVRYRPSTRSGVTERALCACLTALDRSLDDGDSTLDHRMWIATEALADAEVDDLIGALWMIRDFGYIELATGPDGLVTHLEITDAGRRFVRGNC